MLVDILIARTTKHQPVFSWGISLHTETLTWQQGTELQSLESPDNLRNFSNLRKVPAYSRK